ncbi:MAG TPA: nitroreductase family deazaflavin-dependent oxidoreductase [Candidatus Dormibacteraeota bacterium]|nr:nitroreductase family deazaflavin-dependent oxidoreductase [Candidatus Dormibacteraeota bacterium]
MSAPAKAPSFVGLFNPIARRVLRAGPLLGPNALITVRGRKSGVPRTTPIALVEIDGKRWVIGTFGDTNWVRNLRAAGEATLTVGRSREEVVADELDVEARARFFRDVIGPYVRRMRIGALLLSILGAKEILDDPRAAAEHRPVFELRAA